NEGKYASRAGRAAFARGLGGALEDVIEIHRQRLAQEVHGLLGGDAGVTRALLGQRQPAQQAEALHGHGARLAELQRRGNELWLQALRLVPVAAGKYAGGLE